MLITQSLIILCHEGLTIENQKQMKGSTQTLDN